MAVDGRPATMQRQAGEEAVNDRAAAAGPHPAPWQTARMDAVAYEPRLPAAAAAPPADCAPLLASPLAASEADALASTLKALADPARLRLLSLIRAQPAAEACVCHLVEPLGLSQPTVSYHLKVLLESGLVQRERRGSWAYYRVDEATLGRLRDLLG